MNFPDLEIWLLKQFNVWLFSFLNEKYVFDTFCRFLKVLAFSVVQPWTEVLKLYEALAEE